MKSSILPIAGTAAATPALPRGWPLLRLGFRPFYLGAAAYGMLAVPLWIAMLLGQVSLNLTVSPPCSGTPTRCCSASPWR
jgi:uncharacterized protein involved in response to NO